MGLQTFPKTVSDGANVMFCGRVLRKLDRRCLKDGCIGQQAMTTDRSE